MNTAGPPAPNARLFSHGRLAACVGAVALISLLAFETMAVAAAMPAIAGALDGVALYAFAFGGMLATSVLGMVLAGRSCDRHGALRATVAGFAIFGAGLLLSGLASSMAWMVAGRIVQGLGGGMLGVALYVGMGQVVPQALHPRLFALMAAAWVVPGLIGPVAAAWLVDALGWRAVFLVVAAALPLAAALLLPAFARLPAPARSEPPTAPPARLGWALLAVAGALLLNAASAGGKLWSLPLLALGLAFALVASTRLLPRGSLGAAAGLPAVIALRGLLASAFATAEVFLPLMLTHELGWSLAEAGLVLSAGAVFWSCGSALQVRIVAARQRRRALQGGFVAVAAGIALVAGGLLAGHPVALVVVGWSIAGLGIGLAFPMLSVLTLGLSSPADQGRNAAALQLSDALCSAAALALAGAALNLAGDRSLQGSLFVLALAMALALWGALLGRRAFAATQPAR